MAEGKESKASDVPPSFLEVMCTSSGKGRRFSQGTKAGFALSLINNKLDSGAPFALYIEAVKEGEESISFGPSSILTSYGKGWKLQTVVDSQGFKKREGVQNMSVPKRQVSEPGINFDSLYVGKILLVFLFIFMLGGIFTLALENLPKLILFINSAL